MSAVDLIRDVLATRSDWTLFEVARLAVQTLGESVPSAPGMTQIAMTQMLSPSLRLRGHLGLEQPLREIVSCRVDMHPMRGPKLELDVAFMALYGVDSPLAPRLTERLLQEQEPEVRERVRRFLDIFNHRLMELLILAWARSRVGMEFGGIGGGPLQRAMGEILAPPRPPPGAGLSEADLAPYAALFFVRPRGHSGLAQLLRAFIPWPVELQSAVPRRVRLATRDRSGLGAPSACLASTLVLGDRIWDCGSSLRVVVGPVPAEERMALEPGGSLYRRVEGLIDCWCQEPAAWELELRLESGGVTGLCLSARAPASRLGVSSWLGTPSAAQVAVVLSATSVTETLGVAHA